jgi:TatD DNase family protein
MSMRLVDVHCHLESGEFAGDLDRVIFNARSAGIVKLLTASITPDQWELSRSIAARYPEVEYAAGIHPWYIRESYLPRIPELAGARGLGAVAIGEIGLDRKIDRSDFDLQVDFFERQLAIARAVDLPVIIHCRGAFNDLAGILRRYGAPRAGGVIHAFSGSIEVAEELSGLGMSFSMGGTLTMRNSRKRETVLRAIYPDRFLLETDAPDIPPVQARGGTNYPHYLLYNLQAAAEILGESASAVAEHTTANALRLFRLEGRL